VVERAATAPGAVETKTRLAPGEYVLHMGGSGKEARELRVHVTEGETLVEPDRARNGRRSRLRPGPTDRPLTP